MQRNVLLSFGLASFPACSFALKIEKASSQVKLSYISSASSLEILLPYCVFCLALPNEPRGEMHAKNIKLKAGWSEDVLKVLKIAHGICHAWAKFILGISR